MVIGNDIERKAVNALRTLSMDAVFADDEWPGMICVETANAGGADVTVRPGGECVMGVDISLE